MPVVPVDESDDSEVVDDKSIQDDTLLYRRVLNQPDPPVKQIIWDGNLNCWRPSSAAFDNHKDGSGMSVALGDALAKNGLSPESVLDGHEGFSLVCFEASVPRAKQQKIIRKPLVNDPAHGEVVGKKTTSVKRAMVKSSRWVVQPNLPAES